MAERGLNQNWNRDYDSLTGKYIESDPIGLNGGINPYAYVYDNPVSLSDLQGLVVRGGGWSNPQWTQIKAAEAKIRQEASNSCGCHSGSCIPCEVVASLLGPLNNSQVTEAPLFNKDEGRADCGVGAIGGTVVYLSPAAFTKSCGCLALSLYHELLHNAGLDHEPSAAGPGVNDLERRCKSHLCGKGTQ